MPDEGPVPFEAFLGPLGEAARARLQALASGEGIAHPAGRPEGDRMEMRRYVPGDSPRHILWKAFARSRPLEVRTPERSVQRARRTLAYLVAGPDDEAAAAAARVALESSALGEAWLFGADGTDAPTDRLDAALRAIARSAGAREPAGDPIAGLRRFLGLIGPSRAREMFFTGRPVEAELALSWGLVNRVAPAERAEAEVMALAEEIAQNAPLAVQGMKRILRLLEASHERGLTEPERLEISDLRTRAFRSADLAEGRAAFHERRPPRFRGE